MLSWRYLGHPQSGGAEVLTHEVLRRCVASGWEVTAFSAAYPGCAPREVIDGVTVVRRGEQHTVHLHAWRWLRSRRRDFDRVVDQINTIPFLTPLYVRRAQRRMFICQLARGYWFRETRGLFRLAAPLGYLLEPWQTRLYRRTPTLTISRSTQRELQRLGVPVAGVVPMASHAEPLAQLGESGDGCRVVIVGRLTPAKFVEEGIAAFARIRESLPCARLDVVGDGDPAYRRRLEDLVAAQRIGGVVFHGRVSEERKTELLRAADVHLFTSHREGWGLTVTEAAAMGTPTVAYDVPGVRDSVGDPRLLVPRGDAGALGARAVSLLRDPDAYEDVRRQAWERTRGLSWDRTADRFMELVA